MSCVFDETYFDMELFGILTLIADVFGLMSYMLKDSDKLSLQKRKEGHRNSRLS
jgi:hypothetical protein